MAFRYLIYRTDFGNTIVAESNSLPVTGGTTGATFTDFIIPEIQPLYLWRVTGGTEDVVPNTDFNINAWLANEYPPSPDDAVTYNIFTGYTAQTQTSLDGKINIVTGATNNVPIFDASGNLLDSGYAISGLTGGSDQDRYVSGMTYIGSTLTLQRTEGLPDLQVTINATGSTDGVVTGGTLNGTDLVLQRSEGLPDVTIDLSGLTSGNTIAIAQNAADIVYLSGQTSGNTVAIENNDADIIYLSGETSQNSSDIADNAADIIYISGITDTKQDQLSAGEGINVAALAADTIQVDLSAFTAEGGINITLTGGTDAVINDLRTIATGLEYNADYSANFTVRSLTDKGYVDAVASGLDLKASVVVATTTGSTDIDLTGGTFGGTIDGVAISDGDRVLIKNQDSNQVDNGIYVYSGTTFTRADDFVDPFVTSGAFTFVETGTTNGGSGWVLISQDPITIGTTDIIFTQFSSTGSLTAGNGITISNGIVSVNGDDLNGDFLEWTGSQFNVTGLTTVVDFNTYTGATETRLQGIEADIVYLSGQTSGNTQAIADNAADIQYLSGETSGNTTAIADNAADIAYISGVTDTKLDTSVFTGYTASTQANELFLLHTGGTNLNVITPVGIIWHSGVTVGSAYSFTGGTSTIDILEAGEYELTYNIPYNQSGNGDIGIGMDFILNNSSIIDHTSSAAASSNPDQAGSINLASVNVTFEANDSIDLVAFRAAKAGTAISANSGSVLIKKKNTLQ